MGPFTEESRGPRRVIKPWHHLPTAVLLCLAILLALSFEFVNGFHDTANAVATVIYTHTLKPTQAVVWSGMWNLIGVLTSTGAVAFGIVALLPVELVINVGSGAGFAMVFALLLSSIVWNLGILVLGIAGVEFAHLDRLDRRRRFDELPDQPGQRVRRWRQLGEGRGHGQGAGVFAVARVRRRRASVAGGQGAAAKP